MSINVPPLPTQEIGSLPKTPWRQQALTKDGLDGDALADARERGRRLGVPDHEGLLRLLEKRKGFTKKEKQEIKQWASRYCLRFLEETGLDIVYDGEETRTEMYDWPVRHSEGFEDRGWVRSWDHLYFRKAAVVATPHCATPYHLDEYRHAARHARRPLKVPVTGAYTIADWSYDEHYLPRAHGQDARARRRAAREELVHDLARNMLRPNIASLAEAGAPYIQVDEPAASTKPDEVDLFVASFNESVRGLEGAFSVHLCFSDYPLFFPGILGLKNCRELAVELANKDSWGLGTRRTDRPGLEFLHLLADHGAPFGVGLGVVDVHTDRIEPPELVRDRILHAAHVLGHERIAVNPDCGLRTRRWPVVEQKLHSLVEGTRLAREALGLDPGPPAAAQ